MAGSTKKTTKAPAKTPVKEPAQKLETTKDSTKKIETKAGVIQDAKPVVETPNTVPKAAAKPIVEKEAATKKTPAKKSEIKTTFSIQFLDTREWSEKEILKAVKEIWTKNYKRKIGEIKTVDYYIKQEENAVYFVVNGDEVNDRIAL